MTGSKRVQLCGHVRVSGVRMGALQAHGTASSTRSRAAERQARTRECVCVAGGQLKLAHECAPGLNLLSMLLITHTRNGWTIDALL